MSRPVARSSPEASAGWLRVGRCDSEGPQPVVDTSKCKVIPDRPATPRRLGEPEVSYYVRSADGFASPLVPDERQRRQALRNNNPPSGPPATGIPSMR